MNRVIFLRKKGMTYQKISEDTGIPLSTVHDIIERTAPELLGHAPHLKTKQIIELRRQNKTYKEIAEELNLSVKVVTRVAQKSGVAKSEYYDLPEIKERNQKIIDLRKQNKTYRQIASQIGVSTRIVHKVLHREAPDLVWIDCSFHRIPQEDVDEVIRLRKQGLKQLEVAERTGRTRGSVQSIIETHAPELLRKMLSQEEREMREKKVIELQRKGMKRQEIADTLGITLGAVLGDTQRARGSFYDTTQETLQASQQVRKSQSGQDSSEESRRRDVLPGSGGGDGCHCPPRIADSERTGTGDYALQRREGKGNAGRERS